MTGLLLYFIVGFLVAIIVNVNVLRSAPFWDMTELGILAVVSMMAGVVWPLTALGGLLVLMSRGILKRGDANDN